MSLQDPNSPDKAHKPLPTNHGVGAPPFRPPVSGGFMPPHRPPWGPPPAGGIHPHGTMPQPGYFPPHQGGAPPPWGGAGPAPYPHAPPQQQQPRPVSSKPITGTDWLEVTNDNGTKFWHNTKTNQGVWQKPGEVVKASRAPPPLDAAKLKMLERARASGAVIAPEYKAAGKGDKGLLLLEGGGAGSKGKKSAPAAKQQQLEEQPEEEEEEEEDFDVTFTEEDIEGGADEIKNKQGEEEKKKEKSKGAPLPPPSGPPPPSKEEDSATETAFRALLKENSIHGFSRYEKELSKLQKDPRFSALVPPERRRAVFEDYCSKVGMGTKSEEPKKGNKQKPITKTAQASSSKFIDGAARKAAEDAFKALLQAVVVRYDVRWSRVKDDLKKDSRFDSTNLSEKRKEELFTAHIDSLWKVEEARERAARRTHHAKHAGEERQRHAQAAAAERNFKVLLGEAVRYEDADWESTWQRLQSDPQGRATDSMLNVHIAERMFRDHVAELKATRGDGPEEKEGGEVDEEAKRGMDPAYARAYLDGRDAKRPKKDA